MSALSGAFASPVGAGIFVTICSKTSSILSPVLADILGAQDAQLLRQIDGALERIRLNKYGICIGCGKEIPQARLEALPYALMCINCASAEERKRR